MNFDIKNIQEQLKSQSDPKEAHMLLMKYVELYPDHAELYLLLGDFLTKEGKFKKAILAYQKALSIDPVNTEAAISLASLLNDMGHYKEGSRIFLEHKKRLDAFHMGFDPKLSSILSQKEEEIGDLYYEFNRYQEAEEAYQKSFDLNPNNISACIKLSKSIHKAKGLEEAIHFLKIILETHPSWVDIRIQLGLLYYINNNVKEAREEWEQATIINPKNKHTELYLSILENSPESSSVF